MQAWLMELKISWTADMLKSELYQLVKLNKPAVEYVADNMAPQQGFCCRSPTTMPLHPESDRIDLGMGEGQSSGKEKDL